MSESSPASSSRRSTTAVLIAAHRASGTIEATLDAVLRQTRPPARVVVGIDGPDPSTEEVVGRRAPEVEFVVLPVNSGGPGGPRNAAFEIVRDDPAVEHLWFCDADDVPSPRFIEVSEDLLATHPDAAFVTHDFHRWPQGEPLPTVEPSEGPMRQVESFELDDYLGATGDCLMGFAVLPIRSCRGIRESGLPFDPEVRCNEDYEAFVRLLVERPAIRCPWRSGAYRIHQSGHSSDGVRAWLSRLVAVETLIREGVAFESDLRHAMLGGAIRQAARHLWARDEAGDRATAARLLSDDAFGRRDARSLLQLLGCVTGLDSRTRRSTPGDQRGRWIDSSANRERDRE